jgi:hypothetical protein
LECISDDNIFRFFPSLPRRRVNVRREYVLFQSRWKFTNRIPSLVTETLHYVNGWETGRGRDPNGRSTPVQTIKSDGGCIGFGNRVLWELGILSRCGEGDSLLELLEGLQQVAVL